MRRDRKHERTTMRILVGAIAWAICWLWSAGSGAAGATTPATLVWNGIQWNVKSGAGKDPGLNNWSPANAFVDANGDLHLAITNVDGTWYCAEVWTDATFGFGTFQWHVSTHVDTLDPNVVLGLFTYGPTALGPDGTHEIDIEYARFGSATADNGRWTIWPNVIASPPLLGRASYPLLSDGDPTTTSRFSWTSSDVTFATLSGFQAAGSTTNLIRSWAYQPDDPSATISQSPMPVHMNLWLFRGSPPTNGQGVEVVIHDFSFTPAATSNVVPALPGGGMLVLVVSLIGVGLCLSDRRARRSARDDVGGLVARRCDSMAKGQWACCVVMAMFTAGCNDRLGSEGPPPGSFDGSVATDADAMPSVSGPHSSPEPCTTTLNQVGCAADYGDQLVATTSMCPSSSVLQAGRCGDYLVFPTPPGGGLDCVYDGATGTLLGGRQSSDVNSFCGGTSSYVTAGPQIDYWTMCDTRALPLVCPPTQ